MSKRVGLVCLALFSVFLSEPLMAQNTEPSVRRQNRIGLLMSDMTAPLPHDPRRAMILSAMLPGAGQVYNRQAWKLPIVYAAIVGVGYYSWFNFTHMRDYKDEYLYRVKHEDTPLNDDFANIPTSNVYNLYQAYNKSFQLSIIICAAIYGLNIIDAYVFAHLFDFQLNDDISMNFCPALIPSISDHAFSAMPQISPSAAITIRF